MSKTIWAGDLPKRKNILFFVEDLVKYIEMKYIGGITRSVVNSSEFIAFVSFDVMFLFEYHNIVDFQILRQSRLLVLVTQ